MPNIAIYACYQRQPAYAHNTSHTLKNCLISLKMCYVFIDFPEYRLKKTSISQTRSRPCLWSLIILCEHYAYKNKIVLIV